MRTLTRRQIDRQDFVDNQIFELINRLLPLSKQIEWDIEIIANVRDTIYAEIAKKVKNMNKQIFYP